MKSSNPRVRLIAMGFPKAGKTGMLASLANSGRYKIGILDYDHNPDPLYTYVSPERRDSVSIITLSDTLRDDGKRIKVSGEPTAFRNGLRALDHWVDDEGRDFGAVKDWGPDWVLVMDSLTSMGEAAFRRRRFVRPSGSSADDTDSDWGQAMRDQAAMMEILANPKYACNILVLAHLKRIEPKLVRESSRDSQDVKEAKAAISLKRAESMNIRTYPNALGQQLPQEIARYMPGVILVEGDGASRKIITKGVEGLDLGVPAPNIKRELPLESGLLTIFDAILGKEITVDESAS